MLVCFGFGLQFIYSEEATKFCEISTTISTYHKFTVGISQNFVAYSEYMYFKEAIGSKQSEQF